MKDVNTLIADLKQSENLAIRALMFGRMDSYHEHAIKSAHIAHQLHYAKKGESFPRAFEKTT